MTQDLSQPWPSHIEWPETSASTGAGAMLPLATSNAPCGIKEYSEELSEELRRQDLIAAEKLETAYYLWPEICGEGSHE